MDLKIPVKELAYFVCKTGNLSLEFFSNRDLEKGTEIHKYVQKKYNDKSKSEVYIKQDFDYNNRHIILNGFIDGVLNIDDEIIIEEIKSTTAELDELIIKDEHLAQLKIYGYMYGIENQIDNLHLRLTYVSIVDYQTKSFDYILSITSLEEFCFQILEEYIDWLDLVDRENIKKEQTIKTIQFPFPNMRPGQKDLMKACYQTMKTKDILYAIAPTGIGKTMACLFSTLKSLEKNDKLFYLTAKGSGKNAPLSAVRLLTNQGLVIKTINLVAKKKICNAKLKNCKPDECPYAIGFFDRIRLAIKEIFSKYNVFDEEIITKIADKYKVCAFEFSLELSYYCDIVIADYNYVFDPQAHLIRYFEDDTYKPKVLVDEAHNLISRSKEMYSALITEEDIRILRKVLNNYKPSIRKECNKVLEKIDSIRELIVEKALYVNENNDRDLIVLLKNLLTKCDELLSENKKIPHTDEAMDVYFKILNFIQISEYFGPTHRFLAKIENDICSIELKCLDASDFILDTIKNAIKGIVFFSATLTPFKYHADLLTKGEGKFLELPSPFNPANLDIIINNKISTKYGNRTDSIDYIIESIETLTASKKGNYIVFFPSYLYLNMVVEKLIDVDFEIIIQKSNFTDLEKQKIIEKFNDNSRTKVGFFVLGGTFAEGIDFAGDNLSGVIVVGVGLPLYCNENNILRDYFENLYNNGFDYVYTYPGFIKVVQAAGRVIRSETDRGVVILIDERFTFSKYLELMPKHWKNKKVITNSYQLKKELISFFKE